MNLRGSLLLSAALFGLSSTSLLAQPVNVLDTNDSPSATLLMPFFQVDLGNANGWTTVMSINNASATAVLAHVTVWSDMAVPVLAFNVYLTGYDVQVIDMRTIMSATLPRTASDGQDPQDTISPQGNFSQDINFASCQGVLPPPVLPAGYAPHIQNSLTGQYSAFFNGCSGKAYGDNIARGYVTVDTVNNCTLRVPGDIGYFYSGGVGDATNQNVLWGDFYYINSTNNLARGNSLIHVHADATAAETIASGDYTFYGSRIGWSAADNRQPLATTYVTRYLNNVLFFPSGTELLVWRDPKTRQQPFNCGTNPAWYPLGQEVIVAFDESEHNTQVNTIPFPLATQNVAIGNAILPLSNTRGWLVLDLNTTATGQTPGLNDTTVAQALVTTAFNNFGHYSVGYRTIQLDSAANARRAAP